MRAVEQNTNAAYGTSTRRETKKDDKKDTGNKTKGDSCSKDNDYGSYRPKEQFERIIEKKVCAKCFKDDHKLNASNALCKDKKKTPFSVFESLFIVHEADDGGVSLKAQS
jgi:hypothetical protein